MEIENWKNTGSELIREFMFESQTELAEFVWKVARYSDVVNHHADMEINECRKLTLRLSTHDSNGLTEKDFSWATELNKLV